MGCHSHDSCVGGRRLDGVRTRVAPPPQVVHMVGREYHHEWARSHTSWQDGSV